MKFGIYSNPKKDENGEIYKLAVSTVESNGASAEKFELGKHYDFVVTIGGDGTILRVAKHCATIGAPILGINRGTVGFLTEAEPTEIDIAVKKILRREYLIERRSMIDVTVGENKYHALNDAVITRSGCRLCTMEVRVADELIDRFTCDGYIAATPTGSTAYSLSAGGSVISPNTPVIALTPVNPHTLRTRPVVVGSFENIAMTCVDGQAELYIDGQETETLAPGTNVHVTGWDKSALFVRFNTKSFYSRLLDKLNDWSKEE